MTGANYFEPMEHNEYAFVLEGNKEILGEGALAEVGAHAKILGMSRIALFTDPRIAELTGLTGV